MPSLKVGWAPVGVGYVNGLKRCTALLFMIDAAFRLGLLDELKSDPAVWMSFSSTHAVVDTYDSEESKVYANRTLTLSSTETRRRPHAFVDHHQIKQVDDGWPDRGRLGFPSGPAQEELHCC